MDDTSDVMALAKCSSTHASRSARRVPFCSVLFLKFSAVTLQVCVTAVRSAVTLGHTAPPRVNRERG